MKQELDDIIKEYVDIFSKDQYDIGISITPCSKYPPKAHPAYQHPKQIPLKFQPWADNTINKLLDAGMIQRTMSTWASPIIIIPKKGLEIDPKNLKAPLPIDARLRMCCDYRKLNQKLPADFWKYDKHGQRIIKQGISAPYPLPKIDEMFDTICDKRYLTTLDCTGAFHGLKLSPDAAKKSAFVTHLGKFQWNIAPFGLALLPSMAMQNMLSRLGSFTRNYMDDILISSYTETEHLDHIAPVFERFRQYKMRLKWSKCEFLRNKIHFLGHVINYEGIRPLPEKNKEISKIKVPSNTNEVHTLLGVLNYYCRFIPSFSDLMQPLQKLLKKNTKILNGQKHVTKHLE